MPWRRGDRFALRVAAIAAFGLLVRIVYVTLYRHHPVVGDAFVYHVEGQGLANGHGFQRAFEAVPTAEHPPMQTVLLAAADLVGDTGFFGQELLMACIGTCTVFALGFLGRVVGGARLGYIAAGVGATYPMLWIVDGTLLSETPYLLLVTLILLAAYGYLAAPSVGRALGLGALIGLATLTRGEAFLLIFLLAAPLVGRSVTAWRGRTLHVGAVVAAFCVVMAPWTIRNVLTFKDPGPVLIADDGSGVLVGANCHATYYTHLIGSWDFDCFNPVPKTGDESQISEVYRRRGLRFARTHLSRLPLVLLARIGRQFDVYQYHQSVFDQGSEGRDPYVVRWAIRVYWILALLAVAGAVVLRRRGQTLLVFGGMFAMVVLLGLGVYGSTRLRVALEPVIVVLSAVAIEAASVRLSERRGAGSPAVSSEPAAPA